MTYSIHNIEITNIPLLSIKLQLANIYYSSIFYFEDGSNLKLCFLLFLVGYNIIFIPCVAMSYNIDIQSTEFLVAHMLRISTFLISEPQP